jgi:FtsH-binding integral membrane protein
MDYAVSRSSAATPDRVTDALWGTYRWMTLGLGTSGIVAMFVAHSPAMIEALVTNRILFYVLLFAQLGLVMAFGAMASRVSTAAAAAMFFAYAALTGVTFSTLFLIYTATSLATTFFVTAGAFAGLSVVGYVTKRDLSGFGRFALFALIGVVLASVVNMFLKSTGLDWMISVVGILLFAGLTAYDTQKLKGIFASGAVEGNWPLIGALTLYLDFINMFLFLLRFTGDRRRD